MPFALDYLLLVFLASIGTLQLATARGNLKGLYLVAYQPLNLLAALLMVLGSFAWFFISEPRNLPDTGAGLNGNQQAVLFIVGSAAGVAFTLVISSLRQLHKKPKAPPTPPGLEALQSSSFIQALRATLGRL